MTSPEHFSADLLPLVKPIDFVIEDPDNAKLHPDESVDAIAASLKEYGQYKPVVFWLKDGVPVVKMGNGTLRAAKKLGWKRLAMSEFKGTEREAMGAALLDNKTPELAPWNPEVVAAQVAELGLVEWKVEEVRWEAPVEAAAPVIDVVAVPVPEAPKAAPAAVPTTRVHPGDIWILTSEDGGPEHRLMCGDPRNTRVIKELCGMARPTVRRMIVAPDDRPRWWFVDRGSEDSTTWIGWAPLAGAISEEMKRAGWNVDELVRLTRRTGEEVLSWFSGVLIPEDAYQALSAAGVDQGAFQNPYEALKTYHVAIKTTEKDDHEHIRSVIEYALEPRNVFLDTDGGSGSFIGCMNTGRVCFMVLASPEECDSVLEKVEQFTGRKAETA